MRSGSLAMWSIVGLGLSMLPACVMNAAFEIELDLPPNPMPENDVFALVQVRPATVPFSEIWALEPDESAGVELATADDPYAVSVLSSDESLDLHVRVRFCSTSLCSALPDDRAPEVQFSVEHPFYIGERTYWSPTIEEIPATTGPVIEVGRCAIRGCLRDGSTLTNYCRMETGMHLCEDR